MFPERTRKLEDELLPFKSGIYHLAKAHPEVELIPVWIENLGRVMPKGSLIPVPLLCSLTFGAAMSVAPDESKDDFLARARATLKFRISPGSPHKVIDNLNARLKAWWAMIALIGGAIWIGKGGIIALFLFIS